MTSWPGSELEALIGEEALVRLAEAFGGTRLHVPDKIGERDEIARAIGLEAARALSARLAPDVIRVPLARDLRARHYEAANLSHGQIARKLGMTEKGVDRLLARLRAADAPSRVAAQPTLFD